MSNTNSDNQLIDIETFLNSLTREDLLRSGYTAEELQSVHLTRSKIRELYLLKQAELQLEESDKEDSLLVVEEPTESSESTSKESEESVDTTNSSAQSFEDSLDQVFIDSNQPRTFWILWG